MFGLPMMIVMVIINSHGHGGFTLSIFVSSFVGVLVGAPLFSLMMTYTAKKLGQKIQVDIQVDEKIIKEGGANHFKGKEGVGGKLVLTGKRLIFKAHKFNIQNHQEFFEIDMIESVKTFKPMKMFNTGLAIELINKESHKFIVDGPEEWLTTIVAQKVMK
jgi:hypothetical protein